VKIIESYKALIFKTKRGIFDRVFGVHPSLQIGDGLEFEEIGEYSGGDIRHINYKASARSMTPRINLYRDSRRLNIEILYIASKSMSAGLECSKHQRVLEIITALGLVAQRAKDRITIRVYRDSEHIDTIQNSLKYLYEEMKSIEFADTQIDINQATTQLLSMIKSRSIVILIGDFFDYPTLSNLALRHEIVIFRVRAKIEESPSQYRYKIFKNPYDSSTIEMSQNELKRYEEELREQDRGFENEAKNYGIEIVNFYDEEEPFYTLASFLNRYSRKRA